MRAVKDCSILLMNMEQEKILEFFSDSRTCQADSITVMLNGIITKEGQDRCMKFYSIGEMQGSIKNIHDKVRDTCGQYIKQQIASVPSGIKLVFKVNEYVFFISAPLDKKPWVFTEVLSSKQLQMKSFFTNYNPYAIQVECVATTFETLISEMNEFFSNDGTRLANQITVIFNGFSKGNKIAFHSGEDFHHSRLLAEVRKHRNNVRGYVKTIFACRSDQFEQDEGNDCIYLRDDRGKTTFLTTRNKYGDMTRSVHLQLQKYAQENAHSNVISIW